MCAAMAACTPTLLQPGHPLAAAAPVPACQSRRTAPLWTPPPPRRRALKSPSARPHRGWLWPWRPPWRLLIGSNHNCGPTDACELPAGAECSDHAPRARLRPPAALTGAVRFKTPPANTEASPTGPLHHLEHVATTLLHRGSGLKLPGRVTPSCVSSVTLTRSVCRRGPHVITPSRAPAFCHRGSA
jgi:hypothetical protein